jgi:hypothetical protein
MFGETRYVEEQVLNKSSAYDLTFWGNIEGKQVANVDRDKAADHRATARLIASCHSVAPGAPR